MVLGVRVFCEGLVKQALCIFIETKMYWCKWKCINLRRNKTVNSNPYITFSVSVCQFYSNLRMVTNSFYLIIRVLFTSTSLDLLVSPSLRLHPRHEHSCFCQAQAPKALQLCLATHGEHHEQHTELWSDLLCTDRKGSARHSKTQLSTKGLPQDWAATSTCTAWMITWCHPHGHKLNWHVVGVCLCWFTWLSSRGSQIVTAEGSACFL